LGAVVAPEFGAVAVQEVDASVCARGGDAVAAVGDGDVEDGAVRRELPAGAAARVEGDDGVVAAAGDDEASVGAGGGGVDDDAGIGGPVGGVGGGGNEGEGEEDRRESGAERTP